MGQHSGHSEKICKILHLEYGKKRVNVVKKEREKTLPAGLESKGRKECDGVDKYYKVGNR